MDIDRNSLADLGIIDPFASDRDLLSFIDKTRLPESREELQRIVTHPLHDSGQIRARQAELQTLLPALAEFDWVLMERVLDRTELYLAARDKPLPRSWVARTTSATFPSRRLKILLSGMRGCKRFVALCQTLLTKLPAGVPAGELDAIRTVIATSLYSPAVSRLAAAESSIDLMPLDESLRGEARQPLYELVSSIRRVDALLSVAKLASLPGFHYPTIVDSNKPFLDASAAFHPLLRQPVCNDISLGSDERVIFLTGPNMAGKSTYMRLCGLLVVLAQIGAAVPAARAMLTPFRHLFVAVTVTDNVNRHESYFLAEVRRVGTLVTLLANGEPTFALVDEMFKGTNVHDATAATAIVVRALAGCHTCACIASSHLAELGEELGDQAGLSFRKFEVELHGDALRFDYRLQSGVSDARIGMRILAAEGIIHGLAALRPVGDRRTPVSST